MGIYFDPLIDIGNSKKFPALWFPIKVKVLLDDQLKYEHYVLHQLWIAIVNADKNKYYGTYDFKRWRKYPLAILERHRQVVEEMIERGMNHRSSFYGQYRYYNTMMLPIRWPPLYNCSLKQWVDYYLEARMVLQAGIDLKAHKKEKEKPWTPYYVKHILGKNLERYEANKKKEKEKKKQKKIENKLNLQRAEAAIEEARRVERSQ